MNMQYKRRLPRFIAFCGPDGVGKTTQLLLLQYYLETYEKVHTKICWIRTPHLLAWILFKLWNALGYRAPPIKGNKLSKAVWIILDSANVVLKIFFSTYIFLLLGYIVLAERYVVDTIVTNIAYFTKDWNTLKSRAYLFLLRLIPDNSLIIYLDANERIIFNRRVRRRAKVDMHLVNCSIRRRVRILQGIREQRILYKLLINILRQAYQRRISVYHIDTSYLEKFEVFRIIISLIGGYRRDET